MNWNSISIKQGIAILEAAKLDVVDRDIAILSAIYNKPVEYFEGIPRYKLLKKIAKTKWIDQMPSGRQAAPFRHGNYIYKFRTSPNQMSKSDFVMLQKLADDSIGNLHKILAVLVTRYRIFPPKEVGADFDKTAELLYNKMPFGLAYAYALFFSTYYPILLDVGHSFSQGAQEAAKEFLKTR